jgi:hypothetical protein
MSETSTVWVLGAGFSKPLGGPLLPQLFTRASLKTLRLRFPSQDFQRLHDKAISGAHWLYHWGTGFAEGDLLDKDRKKGERLWSDAEDFLDRLDAAARAEPGDPDWERLSEPIPAEFRNGKDPVNLCALAEAARRLLAAECSSFLHNANLDQERWQPFIRWARQVTKNDVVVTFNYDRVLELMIHDAEVARSGAVRMQVVLPHEDPRPGYAPVLKLHGSVDWRRSDDPAAVNRKRYELRGDVNYALKCSDELIGIASPGPTKLDRTQELERLWQRAEEALKDAEAVVFVGYRFPPTDSEARRRLLGAIGQGNNGYKAVHTVLGPESPKDAARLGQLLHWTLRRQRTELADRPASRPPTRSPTYNLVQHQLYGEDFFSVCNRDIVLQPYRWPA